MRCIDCGHDKLFGNVKVNKMIPLKQKGGHLNMKGQKFGHEVAVNAWDNDKFQEAKDIYGPILCGECGAHHVYVVGEIPALRLGDYDDVIEMGKEVFLAQE